MAEFSTTLLTVEPHALAPERCAQKGSRGGRLLVELGGACGPPRGPRAGQMHITSSGVARRLVQAHSVLLAPARVRRSDPLGMRTQIPRQPDLIQAVAAEVADEPWQTLPKIAWGKLHREGHACHGGTNSRRAVRLTHACLRHRGFDLTSGASRSETQMISAKPTLQN